MKSFFDIRIVIARYFVINNIIYIKVFNINIYIAITRCFIIDIIVFCEIIKIVIVIFNKDIRIVITRCSITNSNKIKMFYIIDDWVIVYVIVIYCEVYCEVSLISFKVSFIKSLKLKSSHFNIFSDFLTLNLYNIFIKVKCVELYLIKLFNIIVNCDNIVDYCL